MWSWSLESIGVNKDWEDVLILKFVTKTQCLFTSKLSVIERDIIIMSTLGYISYNTYNLIMSYYTIIYHKLFVGYIYLHHNCPLGHTARVTWPLWPRTTDKAAMRTLWSTSFTQASGSADQDWGLDWCYHPRMLRSQIPSARVLILCPCHDWWSRLTTCYDSLLWAYELSHSTCNFLNCWHAEEKRTWSVQRHGSGIDQCQTIWL